MGKRSRPGLGLAALLVDEVEERRVVKAFVRVVSGARGVMSSSTMCGVALVSVGWRVRSVRVWARGSANNVTTESVAWEVGSARIALLISECRAS